MSRKSDGPKLTKPESIFERSTREAKAITDRDKAARDVKTERLKAARLAKEEEDRDASNKAKNSKCK